MAGTGLGMFLVFLLVKDSLTDDAYITLAYAKNLALHLHWGLIPQEVSNSATSPLNVFLLGAVSAATRIGGGVHPILALGIVSVGLAMVLARAWTRVARTLRLPFAAPALGVSLILLNPFLLSAVGLEVVLIPAVLMALLAMALEERPTAFGVVAGLALLTRLDLVVFVLLLTLATGAIRRRWPRALVSALIVAGPWFAFSWVALGSAVPDTLVIKMSQGGLFGVWTYVTGPVMYAIGQPLEVVLAFASAVAGLFALAGWLVLRASARLVPTEGLPSLGPVAAVGAGGVAYYLTYSVLSLGPYHWYYVPPAIALSIFLAAAVGRWLILARHSSWLRPTAPMLGLGLTGLLALGNLGVDLGQGLPWDSPVIFGNWASARDYTRVGEALHRRIGSATVASPGEIGTLAYACDCAILDQFSDRGALVQVVNQHIANGGAPARLLLKVNYAWLDRSQRPRPLDYRLLYEPGPGSGRDIWQVWSAARGVGHFRLVPVAHRSS